MLATISEKNVAARTYFEWAAHLYCLMRTDEAPFLRVGVSTFFLMRTNEELFLRFSVSTFFLIRTPVCRSENRAKINK